MPPRTTPGLFLARPRRPAEAGRQRMSYSWVAAPAGTWGADPYPEASEFARVDLKKDTLNTTLDQFVMALEKNPAGGGTLKMAWENSQYSVNYTVKK